MPFEPFIGTLKYSALVKGLPGPPFDVMGQHLMVPTAVG